MNHLLTDNQNNFQLFSMTKTAKLFNRKPFDLKKYSTERAIHILPIYEVACGGHFMLAIADFNHKTFYYFDPMTNDFDNIEANYTMNTYLTRTGYEQEGWKAVSPIKNFRMM